jgi:hypothetical protein
MKVWVTPPKTTPAEDLAKAKRIPCVVKEDNSYMPAITHDQL